MPSTTAHLAAGLRDLGTRTARNEEDITALITTTSETLVLVRHLDRRMVRVEHGIEAIASHLGVPLPPADADDDIDD